MKGFLFVLVPAFMTGLGGPAAAGVRQQVQPFEMTAVRAEKPPTIDGMIDEEKWRGAAVARGFVQFEPRRGEPSELTTEALLMYDGGHLYVAFRAWDPEPLTAQFTPRDANLFSDDSVVVLLDTYGDRQSAYYFQTNALGTQADGRIADDGRRTDASWDAPWQSAARRTEFGWTAEFSTRISDFAVVPYPLKRASRLDLLGSDARNPPTEGDTRWVKKKPSPFSSRSMDS